MKLPNQKDRYIALLHDVYNGKKLNDNLTKLHKVNKNCITQAKRLGYVDRKGYSLFEHKPNLRSANKLINAQRIHQKEQQLIREGKQAKQLPIKYNKKPKKQTKITLLWGLITIWK
jgi:hypothetical protein